ncbi:site-specific integrase [Brevibacillus fortis]|uniref:site-specific integrase n=1 Tax=Brevibacillus fortis TaxID=2126352 RepID=UPI002E248503|nr:site-specific integrase [Brevibacillus fortis]
MTLALLDFKKYTISINKTLDFGAKNKNELFGNDLKHHLSYQNQNKLGFEELYHHDLNLVLCRKDGNLIPKSSLFNAFSRTLKKLNIPSMHIHSLRHTHAVLLMETGADMKYIQERLGHGSMQITADVYAHISKKIESDNMRKFEDHMHKIYE